MEPEDSISVKDALRMARGALERAGFESAELEASILVSEATGILRLEIFLHQEERLSPSQAKRLDAFLKRRLSREPLQYIFGKTHFRNLSLRIGPGALVPRQETELLVDILKERLPQGAAVCELGAGSGAICLSLASERPDLQVYASEKSPEAFRWAKENLDSLGLRNARLELGDLCAPFEGLRFDAVVANLPYIPEGEKDSLPAEVRDFEPHIALFSGSDGLDLMRRALSETPAILKPGGFVLLEIGETQGKAVESLALSGGFFVTARAIKDLQGKDRFVLASASR